MLDFSYCLATGNMDEAFKAVKLLKNSDVWKNMAKSCVKTRRLDVALICLGHMGDGLAAKAVREAMDSEKEPEASLAALAIELEMYKEAEELYIKCGRWDLLNELYQV